jgi:hypothetical protein
MQIMVEQKTNGVCAMFGQLINYAYCTREIASGIAMANATFGEKKKKTLSRQN